MKKIIFIEDEPALQHALTVVLNDAGYQVVSALDGEIGLGLIKKEKPDLVLLDLILPKMDGFQVLEMIRKDPETAKLPVIILSNLEENSDINRALELGATTYLLKTNYRLEEVVEKVAGVLHTQESAR
ncbi:MAG: response regulator [bacterium]|nr:response regulator [bacterium]MDZ4299759.1 response regulator [Candidatus Sungbacteria bacterium]